MQRITPDFYISDSRQIISCLLLDLFICTRTENRAELGPYSARKIITLEDFAAGEVWAEDFGDDYFTVGGLVVFEDGGHDPAQSKGGGIISVNQI